MLKILVVIPLYNKEKTIQRAITSVLGQEAGDVEILVINDGSTDNSAGIVETIKNKLVTTIHQENKGVSHARNLGIDYAIEKGFEAIAFLDADDYWMPFHTKQLLELHHLFPKAEILASNYQIKVGVHKLLDTRFSNLKRKEPQLLQPFFKFNYLNSIMTSSSFMMLLEPVDVPRYDEQATHSEDIDFIIQAGVKYSVAFHPSSSVVIDRTAPNRSQHIKLADRRLSDFEKHENQHAEVQGLKKYLDINRFSLAMNHRLENDIANAAAYQHRIDLKNLTLKQRKLLEMSGRQLKALKKTQKVLGNLGFRLRTGR